METKNREMMTIVLVIGLIVVIAMAYMIYINKIIGNKNVVNGGIPNALDETTENLYAADTSNWDESKVTIVYDTEGVPVPVPKGFSASQVDGEHTVRTGFVIYEGEEPVTGTNSYEYGTDAYNASRTRNQWVWVPCSSSDNIYEYDGDIYPIEVKNLGDDIYVNNPYKEDNNLYLDISYTGSGWYSLLKEVYKSGYGNYSNLKIQNDFRLNIELIAKCINTYNGFYISRYECNPTNDECVQLCSIRRK